LEFPRDEYQSLARRDFSALAGSRYSIRAFGSGTVSEQDVRRALEIARKTPSACNRQSWNVYWIKSPELKERLLRIQSGHRGFGEQVDSFLVITSDIQSYFGVEERHQTFVDGGLYSMSVLYALHYIGLGACPLNWCVTWRKDQAMFSALGIPKSQNIIMILAIGTLPDTVKVAKSIRKTVSDTLKVV
jgi:nitroreductase